MLFSEADVELNVDKKEQNNKAKDNILDEDKDEVLSVKKVNFNNVTDIYIDKEDDGDRHFVFYIPVSNIDGLDILGIYETEERAKEVLQEIIKLYKATETFKAISNRISDEVGAIAIENGFVYKIQEK